MQLNRVRNDLINNKYIKSKSFTSLIKFFPDIDINKFSEIEDFHSKMSNILRTELQESEQELSERLNHIDAGLEEIDSHIKQAFLNSNIENPGVIIDRVHNLANSYNLAISEITYFKKNNAIKNMLKEVNNKLYIEKSRVLKLIEDIINDRIQRYVVEVYSENRRSPTLSLSKDNYSFDIMDDTGTGKAYSNLILFDLAVLETTLLPFVIHDSILYKNIQNEAVAKLISLYIALGKQTFIAIDEIQKYGTDTEQLLSAKSVIQLNDKNVLYKKDWRKK